MSCDTGLPVFQRNHCLSGTCFQAILTAHPNFLTEQLSKNNRLYKNFPMPGQMQTSSIEAIVDNLSRKRIARYRTTSGVADAIAVETYVWNLNLCGALLPALNFAEVTVRNAFDAHLRLRFGPRWFESRPLTDQLPARHKTALELAIRSARSRRDGQFHSDEIISELSFGFWVQLATRKAERSIWANRFPGGFGGLDSPENLDLVYRRLERVRVLRNRIAHHDAIFDRDLISEHENLRSIIGWRCKSTVALLDVISKLPHEVSRHPGKTGRTETT
jgi:hypothetical protein